MFTFLNRLCAIQRPPSSLILSINKWRTKLSLSRSLFCSWNADDEDKEKQTPCSESRSRETHEHPAAVSPIPHKNTSIFPSGSPANGHHDHQPMFADQGGEFHWSVLARHYGVMAAVNRRIGCFESACCRWTTEGIMARAKCHRTKSLMFSPSVINGRSLVP